VAHYFFTVASLPMLLFDEQPFYSAQDVIEICQRELTAEDMRRVTASHDYFDTGLVPGLSVALGEFDRRERGVRHFLARLRAQKLGWEYEQPDVEAEPEAERVARDAVSQSSPHDAEMIIQRARWVLIEELGVGHFFDVESLVIYMLKLRVVERNRQMETDRGAERFNEIYSDMVQTLTKHDRSE